MLSPRFRYWVCLVVLCASAFQSRADDRVSDPEKSGEALARLKSLLEKPGLILSTGPESATEHFGVAVEYQSVEKDKKRVWALWAVRDGARLVTLVQSGRDERQMHFQAVACDGIVVSLDPERPGGLVLAEGLQPNVRILSEDDGFRFFYGVSEGEPSLRFDAASVIRLKLPKVRKAHIAADGQTIVVQSARAAMVVTPTPSGSTIPCPISRLNVPGPSAGIGIAVFDRVSAEHMADLSPLTAETIKALQLPIRTVSGPDVVKLLIPAVMDIEADPRHLEAAAKLKKLPGRTGYRFPDTEEKK